MSRVAIVGGRLQGLEAVYLAAKAGMETLVIDKRDNVPARDLSDRFLCCDVLEKKQEMLEEFKRADFVLPALENEEVLVLLDQLSRKHGFVLAFDLKSYIVSSSKLLSDKLIHENSIPAPEYYPDCKAPYIVKPSEASGSEGVKLMESKNEVENFLKSLPEGKEWVAQEFLFGRSYSVEIIGTPGNYRTYQVTEIIIDEVYDCKRVAAPCRDITDEMKGQLSGIAVKIADLLKLRGIMDVEVIDDQGVMKVLEIDARFPSQTPTAVYHSTGINFIQELKDIFSSGSFTTSLSEKERWVSFEHLLIKGGKLHALGEHIIAEADSLSIKYGFCGSDEVLTDYKEGSKCWRGTFINAADSRKELEAKRAAMLEEISLLQGERLEYVDLGPENICRMQ